MSKRTLIIVAIIILALGIGIGYGMGASKFSSSAPVVGHTMPDGSTMSDQMSDMNAGLRDKKGDNLDRAFLEEMIAHHEGAIEMSKILLEKTKRPELVKLGSDIITAQTAEIQMMKEWRSKWYGL